MTEIDDITQQLSRSAGHALRAARQAIDRHRQQSARQREENRREREHRLRVFETRLRTVTLQRREAARQGNTQLAAELAEIDDRQRNDELIARWADAEARRDADPSHADAWTARLREMGVDPEGARIRADELGQEPMQIDDDFQDIEQLATDYTESSTDLIGQHTATEAQQPGHVGEGEETARLIDIAQPGGRLIGPASPTPMQVAPNVHAVDLDHVAGL